jgi:hypothetical protein
MGSEIVDQNLMFYILSQRLYGIKRLPTHPECMITVLLQWFKYMLREGRVLCRQVTISD